MAGYLKSQADSRNHLGDILHPCMKGDALKILLGLLPYQFEAAKSIRFMSKKIQYPLICLLVFNPTVCLVGGSVGLSVSASGCLYPSVCLKKSVKRLVSSIVIPMIHTLESQSAMPSGSSNLGGCRSVQRSKGSVWASGSLTGLRAHHTHMWSSPSLPGLYPPKVCSQRTSNRIFPPRGSSATATVLF